MWTTSEIKARAREKIKKYFLDALIVSFIVGLFAGNSVGGSGGSYLTEVIDLDSLQSELHHVAKHMDSVKSIPQLIASTLSRDNMLLLSILASVATISIIISIAVGIFVKPAFTVGKNRFYAESSVMDRSAGIGRCLWGFKNSYLNVIWVMFVMNLFIMLGTFFFVIPGIYLSFCYLMVPYILAENPEMGVGDVLHLSKDMMNGNKFGAFLLGLSFIGWRILAAFVGLFTFGLGSYLVEPYVETAYAELYLELRKPYRELNGFGRRGGFDDVTKQHTERDEYAGGFEESGNPYHAEGSGYADRGHHQRTDGWTDIHETHEANKNMAFQEEQNGRGGEVKRSEGGPGRGYYLNGVFYPYTEDELRELRENEER